jgi:hypothetical protein
MHTKVKDHTVRPRSYPRLTYWLEMIVGSIDNRSESTSQKRYEEVGVITKNATATSPQDHPPEYAQGVNKRRAWVYMGSHNFTPAAW